MRQDTRKLDSPAIVFSFVYDIGVMRETLSFQDLNKTWCPDSHYNLPAMSRTGDTLSCYEYSRRTTMFRETIGAYHGNFQSLILSMCTQSTDMIKVDA